jgi:hypothetical protein
MSWALADRRNLDRTVHTFPVRDLMRHDFTAACACGPRVIHYLNGNRQIVHNSLDGRELLEPNHHAA